MERHCLLEFETGGSCCSRQITVIVHYAQVMVRDPSALPIERGIMVARGTSGYVRVWGDKVLPTRRLIRVKPEKRHCLYPDEERHLGRGYLRSNCVSNCYQRFMYHDCGCVPGFNYILYDAGKQPRQRISC